VIEMGAPAIDPPSDLTLPQPGSRTAHVVLSAALRRCLGDLVRLPVQGLDAETIAVYRSLLAIVAELSRTNRGALAAVVRNPTVGVWIRCLRQGPSAVIDRAAGFAALVCTMAADLGEMGCLPGPLRTMQFPTRIVSLMGRVVLTPAADARALVFANGLVEQELAAGTHVVERLRATPDGEPLFAEIVPGFVLARVDENPLSHFEAHPDKEGNAIDLGGRPASAWCQAVREALTLVETFLPDLRREMDLVLAQLVPVGYDAERHLSASYQESIGTVYASLHPATMTMAEALIHEFSHNKLNALFELDPVLVNAFAPLFRSPVRPDPRPLHGILLAVHAFLPVARLYEHMLEQEHPLSRAPDFRRRWSTILTGNHDGAQVLLDHADPTPVGRALLDEIAHLDHHFANHRVSPG
jgi:HEXXH motif-containing protein